MLLHRVGDLYSMSFDEYMNTFNWDTYLDSLMKDYHNRSTRDYSAKLQIFNTPSACRDFLRDIAPLMHDLRHWYAKQALNKPTTSPPPAEHEDELHNFFEPRSP